MTNSAASPRSNESNSFREAAVVCASLCLLIVIAATWFFRRGYILYYGDAQAHLNISRSLFDSRTPGYDQIGTVWLPILHLMCLPFTANTWLWSTGLAGTIPVAVCFVIAGCCFYLAAKETYRSSPAAVTVVACFVSNPNLLYLASIPMTEVVFLAGVAVLMLSAVRFQTTQSRQYIFIGIVACWCMSLTRYDGWFLIPFAGLWFAGATERSRPLTLILFCAAASLAPAFWIAHNFWETGNALDFYNGPYSAKAIQGTGSYPGYRDLPTALIYYVTAGQLCSGWPLMLIGAFGYLFLLLKKVAKPASFLLLTPAFYVWSMYSSRGTPIFVPQLWPHGYYNSRYGIAMLAFSAFAAGGIVYALPYRMKRFWLVIPVIAAVPWVLQPSPEHWICWKESQVNSAARRAWTKEGTEFLRNNYSSGDGVLMRFGDLTGIFSHAGIPLKENLSQNNAAEWEATTTRPDLLHSQLWAIAQKGDAVSKAIATPSAPYALVEEVDTKGAPPLQIYRRVELAKQR